MIWLCHKDLHWTWNQWIDRFALCFSFLSSSWILLVSDSFLPEAEQFFHICGYYYTQYHQAIDYGLKPLKTWTQIKQSSVQGAFSVIWQYERKTTVIIYHYKVKSQTKIRDSTYAQSKNCAFLKGIITTWNLLKTQVVRHIPFKFS